MANSLLTISMITRKAIQLFRNSNSFIKNINKEYRSEFGRPGFKIGDTLQIRKPVDYTVRTGPTAVPQNTAEQQVTLTVSTYLGVDTTFSAMDLALNLDDFGDRILAPMVNNLAGSVAATIMAGVETGGLGGPGGIPLIVNQSSAGFNSTGGQATISPTVTSWLRAGALLDTMSCPTDGRVAILSPFTQANTVASLTGLLNPQRKISDQYEKGIMGVDTLGFEKWLSDQTVITHTEGAFGTLGTVTTANQSGSSITTSALNGPLNVGDIISFTGVNFCNRVGKEDTGILATFVVTAAAAANDTSVSIYPPLTPPAAGQNVQYQTVTKSPAASAPILSPVAASQIYRKNFVFHPSACTAVFVDLPVNMPGTFSHRENFDGVAMRMLNYYAGTSDQDSWRLDVLFGSVWPRPEWAVVVTDITT